MNLNRFFFVLLLGIRFGADSTSINNFETSLLCCRELSSYEVSNFSMAFHHELNRKQPSKSTSTILQQLLLLLSGTVEINPGPSSIEDLNEVLNLKGIKIIHQNIRGLFGKRAILQTLFNRQKCILTLSETHMTTNDSEIYKMGGYQFIHRNRQGGEGGGVAMYISEDVAWKRREDLETDDIESIWIEIDILKGKNFLVGCIHRPPDSSLYLPKDFITHLSEMVTKVNNTNLEIFLLGDINVNYL